MNFSNFGVICCDTPSSDYALVSGLEAEARNTLRSHRGDVQAWNIAAEGSFNGQNHAGPTQS